MPHWPCIRLYSFGIPPALLVKRDSWLQSMLGGLQGSRLALLASSASQQSASKKMSKQGAVVANYLDRVCRDSDPQLCCKLSRYIKCLLQAVSQF